MVVGASLAPLGSLAHRMPLEFPAADAVRAYSSRFSPVLASSGIPNEFERFVGGLKRERMRMKTMQFLAMAPKAPAKP